MRKYFMLLLGLIILCPMSAKGLMCSNKKKVEYQEMAKNITANYEYVESDNDIVFNIKISNIPNMFIVYDAVNKKTYDYTSNEIVINNVNKKTSYRFDIYKNDDACAWVNFYSHYVNVPAYNYFYKDDICKGIEDYKLCNKWLDIKMNYDEWKTKVQIYKDSLDKNIIKEDEKRELTIFDKIINFYADYYIFILPSIIVICLIGRFIYNKKHDLF